MPSLSIGVIDAKVEAKSLSPPNQAGGSLGGCPVNIDIADLSIGSILGKGSFAVVNLLICPEHCIKVALNAQKQDILSNLSVSISCTWGLTLSGKCASGSRHNDCPVLLL